MALSREDLVQGLRQVIASLRANGEPSGIRIVGGAALSLRYFDRGTTDDIDAQVHPPEPTLVAAAEVAATNGWPEDWFNTAATQFIPFGLTEWEPLLDDADIGIWVASARMLLAMKLRASRPGRDDDDIANLLALCAINTVAGAEALFEEFYSGEILEPKAHKMLTVIYSQGLPDIPVAPPTAVFD